MKRKLNQLGEFNHPGGIDFGQTKAVKRTIFTMNIEEPSQSDQNQNQPMFNLAAQKPKNQQEVVNNACVFQTGSKERLYLNEKTIFKFSDMFES